MNENLQAGLIEHLFAKARMREVGDRVRKAERLWWWPAKPSDARRGRGL